MFQCHHDDDECVNCEFFLFVHSSARECQPWLESKKSSDSAAAAHTAAFHLIDEIFSRKSFPILPPSLNNKTHHITYMNHANQQNVNKSQRSVFGAPMLCDQIRSTLAIYTLWLVAGAEKARMQIEILSWDIRVILYYLFCSSWCH